MIGAQPSAQTVTSGSTAGFGVTLSSFTGTLTYQWRKGGVAINTVANPSAATNNLNLGTVTTTDSGSSYDVVVTDSVGSVTSSSVALTVNKISTTLAFGGLTQTYNGSPCAATVTPTPSSGVTTSLSYTGTGGTTYGPSTTAPTNAGSYTVTAAITDSEHVVSGSATNTLTINPATVTFALGGLAATYDGAAHAATATPTPSGVAFTLTYTGTGGTTYGPTTNAPTNAGSYTVAAASADANYTGTTTGTLVITPAAATITLSGLTATYDGAAHAVTATTTPTGLPVNFTYAGSPTAPTNAGTYAVVATIGATNYSGTDNTHSLVIAQATQTITFGAVTASPAVSVPFTVSATASSGFTPVTFSIVSGNATATGATGSTITLGDTNNVTIRASQAGDLNITAATADLTLRAGQLPQTITFAALPPRLTTESIFLLNATASSGLTVTYSIVSGPATLTAGTTVILSGTTGTVTVRAAQAGNAFYLPAGSVDQSFVVSAPAAAPAITTQPASQTVNAGSPATFTVVATGSPAPTYQWRKAGTAITGATTATFTIAAVAPADAGDYDVVAANSGGSIVSGIATLFVPAVPTITTQPAAVTVGIGGSASFTVAATGTPAPTYQWRKAGVAISGATGATFTLASVVITDAASYDVVVTNLLGSVTSSAAALTVTKTAQTITFAAPTGAAPAGSSVRLTATASSGLPVTFALIAGSGSINGTSLVGSSAAITVRAIQAGDASYDAATPVDRTFTFVSGGLTPFLLTSPVDQTVAAGATVTFTASGMGTPTPTWQWQKDGVAIAGATNATLTLASVTPADTARYTVVATNAMGTASASATLTVRAAPVITTAPAAQSVNAGTTATFTVVASGTPVPTYQWRKNGVAITGATGATLALANVRATDAASYDVVVTNTLGSATSAAAQLTVVVHDYSGAYFGRFTGATGDFALYVRANGTAAFVGYLPGLGTAIVSLDLAVDLAGNFSLATSTLASAPSLSPLASSLTPPIAAAPRTITLRGTIEDTTGTISGSVPELAVTLGGTRAPATGTAAAQAGFYQGAFVGSADGRGYMVVGADGRALMLAVSSLGVDGAAGTLGPNGRLTLTTAAQTSVDVTFANGAVSGTVRTAAGVTAPLAGATATGSEHLVNLSILGATSPDAPLITGFVIGGSTAKQVLIRAAGPAISAAPYNVANALPDPTLQIFRGSAAVAQNDNWGTPAASAAAITTAASAVNAFAFRNGSADAAVLTTLAPGAYTVVVGSAANAPANAGSTLAEIYEVLESGETAGLRRLANLSARGVVAPGSPLTLGFVIGGNGPQRVLVRGIGPGLTAFGVPGTLANPSLTILSGSTAVKTNDDWFRDADAALITAAAARVGAFPLGAQSLDAAALVYLAPGPYTVRVTGPGANATGAALMEIYEAP